MANFFTKFFGTKSQRDLKQLNPILQKCLAAYDEVQKLTNDELRAKTIEFKGKISTAVANEQKQVDELKARIEQEFDMAVEEKQRIYTQIEELEKKIYDKTQSILDELLPQAFAVVKETAKRFTDNEKVEVTASEYDKYLASIKDNVNIVGDKAYYDNSWIAGGTMIKWNMVHYDVQLIGGTVLHQGKIAEMATGEGKTLVGTLPIYLNALSGKGVHVVTVNDYLAKRDSEWMGMLFEFHGLSVDCIDKHEPNSEERRKAYNADITYGTNNEFGFDYLRDNMCSNTKEIVQREHNYAIVDEVDSVLIDDARTPLIISGPTPKGDDQEFERFCPVIEKIYNAQKQLVTQILASAKKNLTAENRTAEQEREGGALLLRAHHGLPKNKALIKFLSEPGMKALLLKTENFYMQDQSKEMHIIDDELFFVINEQHNSIELTDKGMDYLANLGEDPKFFTLPDVGSQLADLEKENLSTQEKSEKKEQIMQNYAVQSDRVHTINQLMKAYALFENNVEYVVIDNQVKIVDEQTGRIMEGRRYSDGLHQAIEAKERVKVEAATQTYATITLQNYFRMYSKLAGMTGTAETEAGELWDIYKLDVVTIPTNRPVIRHDNDDLIYKTKREKFAAVIMEVERLVGENRPVLIGTTDVETSELLSRMLKQRRIEHQVLNAKLHKKEADIVAQAGRAGAVTIATNMAGRGTDIKLQEGVKEAGGLAIIGTERHESRRVDRQLRGRSGRQGDPGSSQFFVSLEDKLMRLFGSDRMVKVMDRLGIQEGEVIQHSMMTKSIERAQRKVEENNFGIRKRLLEYDDVMNNQRTVVYTKRRNALYGDKLAIDISNMIYDTLEVLVGEYKDDYENFCLEFIRVCGYECPLTEQEFNKNRTKDNVDSLYSNVYSYYKERLENISKLAFPFVKNIYETKNYRYENIAFPITDGKRTITAIAPIEKSYQTEGKEIGLAVEKSITLQIIDNAWKEHLRELDDLKQSVQNASYEQKDPLLIYKFESFSLFEKMLSSINKDITTFLCRASLPIAEQQQVRDTELPKSDNRNIQTSRQEASPRPNNPSAQPKPQPVHVEKKVGRNDPCPCGSGKKYKHCHGKMDVE
ncbi:MAG: preprotein translocase subunit SecA [Bacteroidales bacterium]|nr:preprotein translocase subunit SecA [Bacteroidales bacterium]MBQ2385949.1 preprotein translocase subunit SecA [Bacteroidales bacterium]